MAKTSVRLDRLHPLWTKDIEQLVLDFHRERLKTVGLEQLHVFYNRAVKDGVLTLSYDEFECFVRTGQRKRRRQERQQQEHHHPYTYRWNRKTHGKYRQGTKYRKNTEHKKKEKRDDFWREQFLRNKRKARSRGNHWRWSVKRDSRKARNRFKQYVAKGWYEHFEDYKRLSDRWFYD